MIIRKVQWLPVQAGQWHAMHTQALVDIWQASETSFKKVGQSTLGSGVVVVSLLMELSIGDEKLSLPFYAYVAGFGKASEI